ncbi:MULTISPECIES: T9SS type A sorting domain-containing protein [unclassified Chryseobacterium]|uniref:T9SS type A sorting domain-containing protein n=1 Tax=unclassified Chryseobacterium TaxID=2593645 RepID=UPI000F45E93D|nr:T9SS type A sorting domain-containing protein [Chryseobacterium sp. G0240]ROI03842.1 T9SS C-terminal target domain-containing protein [Chryseobacterium sp. G0240]
MQKILSFIFTLIIGFCFAQFTANDIKFFVGTGSQTAYFVADFKDGTDDRSYAWGVRFNPGQNITGPQMLQMIKNAEPAFDYYLTYSDSFLDELSFNDHSEQSGADYWSLWRGDDTNSWSTVGWMNNGTISDGKWYGASYGFSNPTAEAPSTPIPAYSSLWYNSSQITNWIGTGSNKSLVVIDFGTDNSNGNANSFVFGIQYDGTITAEQALQIIQSQSSYFNFTSANNQVSTLSLNSFTGNSSGSDTWKLYKGNDLSNWKTQTGLSQVQLNNNDWLGLSFGQRRPFTPTEATQSNLGVSSVSKKGVGIYPNPATDYIQIHTEGIKEVNIYAVSGQKVITSQANKVNIQSLSPGLYFVEVKTSTHSTIHKIVKK